MDRCGSQLGIDGDKRNQPIGICRCFACELVIVGTAIFVKTHEREDARLLHAAAFEPFDKRGGAHQLLVKPAVVEMSVEIDDSHAIPKTRFAFPYNTAA